MVLFSRVEPIMELILYELINNSVEGNRKVFFIHGGVDEDREQVREITEREDNYIIVISYGTFSTRLILKDSITLSLHHPVSQELEIFNRLVEYLEKEKIKVKQSSTTSWMIVQITTAELYSKSLY